MTLRDIAHARAGDKGDTCNISVIAFDARDYPRLVRHVTPERVTALFADLAGRSALGGLHDAFQGDVVRYELPQLGALNFVVTRALGGGVTRSLALDAHGKSLSSALLTLEIPEL